VNGVALVEAVYRAERARVLATTIRATYGDFDLAEEVVQETFASAIAQWPSKGTPQEPLGWLISVARRKAIDAIRRRIKWRQIVRAGVEEDGLFEIEPLQIPDDRLRLIFTCCHPALAPEAQVALTLQTLGGLTTDEIARAFLVQNATMAQRLVRAKNKIKTASIRYEVPDADELAERLQSVTEVLYLIFNEGYAATRGDAWIRRDLCNEAIRLSRMLLELTRSASVQGLLALMLLHDSRRDARTNEQGDVVLLEHQNRELWDCKQIDEALELVPAALRGGADAYALQAAIAALHASAKMASATDWPQIAALYGELMRRAPSPIVALNRAVAIAMTSGPAAGLALLEPLKAELSTYHLWHSARADLLRQLNRNDAAADAYRDALRHVGSDPERRFLERRLMETQAIWASVLAQTAIT
jgi:RNA polymerase sigma-70 factor (ECF subfamily)